MPAPKTTWRIPSASDPMGLKICTKTAEKADSMIGNATNRAVRGLWRFNGIDQNAEPVDLFIGVLMGMALMTARWDWIQSEEQMARVEAKTAPEVMAKAKRMVRAYDSAMADAERTIKGQAQQLELF